MLRCTPLAFRRRTPWRELLHPLPIKARQREWLKRDLIEVNEATLRRPYYTLRQSRPEEQRRRDALHDPRAIGPQLPEYTLPRDVMSLRSLAAESWDTIPIQQSGRR